MIHPISFIGRKLRRKKKYNILCFPTHEGYQSNLDKTGHNFLMVNAPNMKQWDYHTRPLPKNHYIINLIDQSPIFNFEVDLILSQERTTQLPMALDMQRLSGAPVIHLEHTEPLPQWSSKRLDSIISTRANKHVYITEHNKKSWKDNDAVVIPHGIDDNIFKNYEPTKNSGVSVVNLFPHRDIFCGWQLWNRIKQEIPLELYGYNPGLSESINDPQRLNEVLRHNRFFLNTSQLSPIPLSLLEAACIGMPIVSTANQEVPKIFTNGVNAILSNDPKELIEACKYFINPANASVTKQYGDNARKLILEKFSMQAFVDAWNNVFNEVVS